MSWRDQYAERGAARYDRVWATFTGRSLAPVLALATPHLSAHQRVLDVGCGTGVLLGDLHARESTLVLTGLDGSAAMLAHARQRLGSAVTLQSADLNADNALADLGQFDLITCTNVLHYLRQPAPLVRGIRTHLAPGGRLIVSDFVRHGWWWPAFEAVLRGADRQHQQTATSAAAPYSGTPGNALMFLLAFLSAQLEIWTLNPKLDLRKYINGKLGKLTGGGIYLPTPSGAALYPVKNGEAQD